MMPLLRHAGLRRAGVVIVGAYGASLAVAGCSKAPSPQDECSWIADPNNCLHRFADDIGLRCADRFVNLSKLPDPVKAATGLFANPMQLDLCAKINGGQVVFDPPLKPSQLPLTTATFKILDDQANPCAEVAWSGPAPNTVGPVSFSINVDPINPPPTAPKGAGDLDITGGTFAIAVDPNSDTSDTIDLTCPGGAEAHVFDSLVLENCSKESPLQPTALLLSSPGIAPAGPGKTGTDGYIRFFVVYPPDCRKVPDPAACLNQPPRVVQYFDCTLSPPPGPCQDGVQDGSETDVDCGGALCDALGFKCQAGQKCVTNNDCAGAACAVVMGLRECAADHCSDGIKDADETDVDCGGSCVKQGKACAIGMSCLVNTDCQTGVCTMGKCAS